MNTLGPRFGLSPATMAGLAQIAGSKPPVFPEDELKGPPGAPVGPDGLTDAERAAGVRALGGGGEPIAAASNPSKDPNWNPEVEKQKAEQMEADKALAGATPQGPGAPQDFPTVRSFSPTAGGVAAPAGPTRVVPAHWQPGTHAVSMQRGMNPDELEPGQQMRDAGAGLGLEAGDKRLEAAQRAAQADGLYAAARTYATQQANERIAALNQQRDAYVQQERQKLEKLATDAQAKIDPKAYWQDKGTLGKIGAAIAIGLGQFGASMKGGPNGALQIIQAGIDRNIAAQQANIAQAGKAYDIKSNLYARNLQEFGDKERAILATKINYLDQVAGMVDAQKAVAKSVDADAAALDLKKRIFDERAQYADQFAKLTHTQVAEQQNEHFVPTQVVGGAPGQKGLEDRYVPTLGGYARSSAVAEKINAKGAVRMQMSENLRQIHSLMDEAKKLSSSNPKEYLRLKEIDEQIQSLTADTLQQSNVMRGQGAMSEGDKAVTEQARALKGVSVQFKPNMTIERYQRNIKQNAERLLEEHRLEGEANGIQVGTEEYATDPRTGQKVPVAVRAGRNKTVTKNTEGYDDLVQAPKGEVKKR